MKILGILKNKSKKENLISNGVGSFIGIKDFLVANATLSVSKLEKSEGKLITIDELLLTDFNNFIDKFDKIISFGNNYKILRDYYNKYTQKFIFLEGSLYQRDPFKSLPEHNYFRVMTNTHLGNNYIKKYSNNHIRDGFTFTSKTIRGEKHVLLINNDMIGDNAVDQTQPFYWLEDTINKIVKKTKKKIIIRLHPNQSKISEDLIQKIRHQTKHVIELSDNKYISDDLKEASIAVMYSSGSCVDCLLSGIPVVSTDPRSFCYELLPKKLDQFDNFDMIDFPHINGFLSAVSNTHFTVGEIISGEFWKILKGF